MDGGTRRSSPTPATASARRGCNEAQPLERLAGLQERPEAGCYRPPTWVTGHTLTNARPTSAERGTWPKYRESAESSRCFGQVPRSALVGRAFVKVWPVTHVGGLKHPA